MKTAFYSAHPYDRRAFAAANADGRHELVFIEARLTPATVGLARHTDAVCAFVNDQLDRPVLAALVEMGIHNIALRSAGYNHVDLAAARKLGLRVAHVPHYSPHAVAEYTIALMLALNRKIHRAHARVREGNFSLDGLLGFDFHGRTAGLIGSGLIGCQVARILQGFGCKVLAHDPHPPAEARTVGATFVSLDDLLAHADVVTLHCPLTPETRHLIDAAAIARMRPGVMLINTSRGGLVDSKAVIEGLKSGQIGYLGLDVYEDEAPLFYQDCSDRVITDDVFSRLLTFPNVIITGHQAFFTAEAVAQIAQTTLANLTDFEREADCANELTV